MNCNVCGAPLPEGTNFCNSCGSPVQPQAPVYQAPVDYQQPIYQAPVPPQPPKKSNTGLIVGITVGLIGIFVLVFCILGFVAPGFLLDKEEETTTDKETTSAVAESTTGSGSSTTKPDPAPAPEVELDEAEAAASYYLESVAKLDIVEFCDSEVISWAMAEDIFDEILLEAIESELGYSLTAEEMYELIAEESGENIYDAESYLDVYLSDQDTPSVNVKVNSSKELTKSEANAYINKTKANIDEFNDYGLYSDDISWDEIESYALVNCTLSYDGETEDMDVVLGCAYGDWYVIYGSDPSGVYLASLSFFSGMLGY